MKEADKIQEIWFATKYKRYGLRRVETGVILLFYLVFFMFYLGTVAHSAGVFEPAMSGGASAKYNRGQWESTLGGLNERCVDYCTSELALSIYLK